MDLSKASESPDGKTLGDRVGAGDLSIWIPLGFAVVMLGMGLGYAVGWKQLETGGCGFQIRRV